MRQISCLRGRWINDSANLGDTVGGKTTTLCVFADDVLIVGEVDAEGLVRRHIGFLPLDVRRELCQHLVLFLCGRLEFLAVGAADGWKFALDDVATHGGLPWSWLSPRVPASLVRAAQGGNYLLDRRPTREVMDCCARGRALIR
jgi:hypothetical protein